MREPFHFLMFLKRIKTRSKMRYSFRRYSDDIIINVKNFSV